MPSIPRVFVDAAARLGGTNAPWPIKEALGSDALMTLVGNATPHRNTGADAGPHAPAGLVQRFLDEQSRLTAVAQFAQFHDEAKGTHPKPWYTALLPGRAPRPGQQYAFEVDLDRCSGCKACVAACHSLNGLDDGEAWREVGLIVGGPAGLPVLQHVTSSCHHCLDPACLRACPVDAYEKDPITGIVRHLDDQCFGCQYCTLACPYDAPKFHAAKGIVRKCDMCAERLAVEEPPACVQGCPHEAIRIRIVDESDVISLAASQTFLPTAPAPDYTLPTTRYVSERALQGPVRAADEHRAIPEHAHPPLVLMLVLTQAAVGGFLVEFGTRLATDSAAAWLPWMSLLCGVLGIAASLAHLGRPAFAYRAIIGFRHSWLSREVAAFGLFGTLAAVHCAAVRWQPEIVFATGAAVGLAGVLAVFCSVMVYHVVRRPFWHLGRSGAKFAGTALVCGLALANAASGPNRPITIGVFVGTLLKLAVDLEILTHLLDPRRSLLKRTAHLLCGTLKRPSILRLALAVLGGIIVPAALLAAPVMPATRTALATAGFLLLLGGEVVERTLYFKAVVRPKMPGGLTA